MFLGFIEVACAFFPKGHGVFHAVPEKISKERERHVIVGIHELLAAISNLVARGEPVVEIFPELRFENMVDA